MKSDVITKAENLYQSGQTQEALKYYASSLWNEEESNPELLSTWLADNNLIKKVGEQAVCTFIGSILFTIDRCEDSLKNHLWTLCQNLLDHIIICEDREDTFDRYVREGNRVTSLLFITAYLRFSLTIQHFIMMCYSTSKT